MQEPPLRQAATTDPGGGREEHDQAAVEPNRKDQAHEVAGPVV